MSKFELVEHTADIGLVAYGKTKEELFENAGEGLFSIITDLNKVSAKERHSISTSAEDLENLFICWLNELIYFWEVNKTLASKFEVSIKDDTLLEAVIYGERFDHSKHTIEHGVKAVTYYEFKLGYDQTKKIWTAKVIIDV